MLVTTKHNSESEDGFSAEDEGPKVTHSSQPNKSLRIKPATVKLPLYLEMAMLFNDLYRELPYIELADIE